MHKMTLFCKGYLIKSRRLVNKMKSSVLITVRACLQRKLTQLKMSGFLNCHKRFYFFNHIFTACKKRYALVQFCWLYF